jgi:DNA-directed RNA polymerase subunit N (RpoN/RPB10)
MVTKRKGKTVLQKAKDTLWKECRRIIRERYGDKCFTCGKSGLTGANYQTGHYIPSSVCSVELRYSLDNLRPQCFHCNINLSGNWLEYEAHLKEEIGEEGVIRLRERNKETKGLQYPLAWYTERIKAYKSL